MQLHTHTDPHTVLTDELNDLAATGDAYLGSATFMSEGMRPLIKPSASVSLERAAPVPARQSEGGRVQELTGSSNCGRTQPWRTGLTLAVTSAARQRPSCSAAAAVPPFKAPPRRHLYLMTVWVNKHEASSRALPSVSFKIFVSLKTVCISSKAGEERRLRSAAIFVRTVCTSGGTRLKCEKDPTHLLQLFGLFDSDFFSFSLISFKDEEFDLN